MSKSVHAAIVGAILLWSTGAMAQACEFGKEITFKGSIGYIDTKNSRQFVTLDRPTSDCVVIFMRAAGQLPGPCRNGSPFTATGKLRPNPGDRRSADFDIGKITCP